MCGVVIRNKGEGEQQERPKENIKRSSTLGHASGQQRCDGWNDTKKNYANMIVIGNRHT